MHQPVVSAPALHTTNIVTTLSNMKTSILRDKEMDFVFSVRCVPALSIPLSPLYQMLLQCFKGGALTLRGFNIHTCMLVQLICRPFHTKEDLCVSCLLSCTCSVCSWQQSFKQESTRNVPQVSRTHGGAPQQPHHISGTSLPKNQVLFSDFFLIS